MDELLNLASLLGMSADGLGASLARGPRETTPAPSVRDLAAMEAELAALAREREADSDGAAFLGLV